MALTGHELARRLLQLPDDITITLDGDFIAEATASRYDSEDGTRLDAPCVVLDLTSKEGADPRA